MPKPISSNLKNYRFGKHEHLKKQVWIELLFSEQQSIFQFPFKIYYYKVSMLDAPEWVYAQVMFPVAKRVVKRAVKRNRARRLMRELYRLNKSEFIDELRKHGVRLVMAISCVDPKNLEISKGNIAMKKALEKVLEVTTNYV